MGSVETTYEKSDEGFKPNINSAPEYLHITDDLECTIDGKGTSFERIDSALSCLKVSTRDADSLRRSLEEKHFSRWQEKCEVREYFGYTIDQLESLLRNMSSNFHVPDVNIYKMLANIKFARECDAQIYNFRFGNPEQSGKVYLGMVTVIRSGDYLDAVSCLYSLDFELGQTLVTEKKEYYLLGFIPFDTQRTKWLERKKLGFLTEKALVNLCRVKALEEFKRRNIVSRINDFPKLNDI